MENFTANDVWFAIVVVIVVGMAIMNVVDKFLSLKNKVKEPENIQNNEIELLKDRVGKLERKVDNDGKHLNNIDDSMRVTQRGMLALLGHGIDGNNTDEMKEARTELQQHLINK